AGCLDCLIAAYKSFETLSAVPSVASAATLGAIRAAALVALREWELLTTDDGYVELARRLAANHIDVPDALTRLLAIVDALPHGGVTRAPASDAELAQQRRFYQNRDAL